MSKQAKWNTEQRKTIPQTSRQQVQGASKLKDGQDHLKKIFIKKDQHPEIYREKNRLKPIECEEKAKPEKNGINVFYDWKTRCVYTDNQIIDFFSPSFF